MNFDPPPWGLTAESVPGLRPVPQGGVLPRSGLVAPVHGVFCRRLGYNHAERRRSRTRLLLFLIISAGKSFCNTAQHLTGALAEAGTREIRAAAPHRMSDQVHASSPSP